MVYNSDSDFFKSQEATVVVSEVISRHKEEYQNHLTLMLSDPMTNAKTYWSLLKIFLQWEESINSSSTPN